ncbi:transmembrane protein 100-like [Engraulis encrasicolus]|uniref:transmembrane protein 100-like n=1 Tax=Engraulis encrasicolus TaxID=184585 RepID=UPI002FD7153F
MATPDPPEPAAAAPTPPSVTYDPRSETVTLPGGIVSVAGVTVVTGGTEMSCGSCTLALGMWGTLIGISVVAVGLRDRLVDQSTSGSILLTMGLVILSVSVAMVALVGLYRLWRCKAGRSKERDEGKMVLVEDADSGVIKTVTV